MRSVSARAYPSAASIALAGAIVWMLMLHGCASTTKVATPQSAASALSDEHYEKVLKLLADEPNTVLQIASKHLLENATRAELERISCLAQSPIGRVLSRGEPSDTLKNFIDALIATIPRGEHSCAPVSNQWHVAFFTYSRWKTHRVPPEQRPRERSEFEDKALEFIASGSWPLVVAVVVGGAVVYGATCVSTAGAICPIPGETIFVALGTSIVSQQGTEANLVGVGVAQGSSKISAWSAVGADPEALGLALSEALKSLASNYAAFLVSQFPTPSEPSGKPLPKMGSRPPSEFFGMARSIVGGDPATAEALILLVSNSGKGVNVSPLFLSQGQDKAAFVEVTLSLRPQEILNAMPAENSEARFNTFSHGCIIFASGRLVELRYDPFASGAWKPPRYSRVTFEFKREAVNALRSGGSDYHGAYVCSLERTRWSSERRAKVIAFLERVNVGSGELPETRQ